jgi:phage terminase large subunit-like protein
MGESLASVTVKRVGEIAALSVLSYEEAAQIQYAWEIWARPEQLPPIGRWLTWLLLAGRGFGKSRTGAEWVRMKVETMPGSHGALIAPTAADARDVMVKTLTACSPNQEGLLYEPSKRLLLWANGTTATLYSAEEPDRLRGPQHHWAWCDELAAWPYADEVWDMLQMTLRLGDLPQVVVSTTPRPIPIIRRLIKESSTVFTKGSTFDNAANLSEAFIATVREHYDGTRLGRQELHAEILDDIEGALWSHRLIDRYRVRDKPDAFTRMVVAVDPAGSAKKTADETGIITAGIAPCSCKGSTEAHGFVLEDLSDRYSPADMGRIAIAAYHRHKADRIVAEDNFGGKIIEDLLHLIERAVPYRAVHASRGKIIRAEPIAALYERGMVHHVGMHAKLEDELCTYTPLEPKSPGRMDALVWALTDLMLGEGRAMMPDDLGPMPTRRM